MADPETSWVSAQEMDAIFGSGWRYPYCLWPRRSAPVEKHEAITKALPKREVQVQLRLEG